MGNVSLSTFSLTVVSPSDETAIRNWFELRCAVARGDWPDDPPPCWLNELGQLRHPEPGTDAIVWLARLDGAAELGGPVVGGAVVGGAVVGGAVVGGCALYLPTLDNLQTAVGEILVTPEYRRRGIGRMLLAHLREEAARHGRNQLLFEVEQPLDPAAPDPGGCFATASGAECALVVTRRRLDIGSVDPDVLARLDRQARPKSQGYSLVQWVGTTPRRWLDDMAYLTGRMSTDAPLDDLQWSAEAYDAARIQGRDASRLGRGLQVVTTGAVDDGGRLVAFTQILGFASARWYADQWETIVAPEHRGHRLGVLIKLANLDLARTLRPELRVIDTWNANSNLHMVAINEAMGFRPWSRTGEWQLDLVTDPAQACGSAVPHVVC